MTMFRRKWVSPFEPQDRYNGLCEADFNTLALYNAECNRGIVHTAPWKAEMALLQERFDRAERARYAPYLEAG